MSLPPATRDGGEALLVVYWEHLDTPGQLGRLYARCSLAQPRLESLGPDGGGGPVDPARAVQVAIEHKSVLSHDFASLPYVCARVGLWLWLVALPELISALVWRELPRSVVVVPVNIRLRNLTGQRLEGLSVELLPKDRWGALPLLPLRSTRPCSLLTLLPLPFAPSSC